MNQPTLHDLLLQDWGTDLPISGGFGGSREDPIVINATDASVVALTQMSVFSGIGRGRRIFWRSIKRVLLGDQWPSIEQFKLETVELTKDQKSTQLVAHYFNVAEMIAANQGWVEVPVVGHIDKSGIVLPYEISWLHFGGTQEYEAEHPGLGQSIQYGAPGIKSTVYIYDKGYADIPADLNCDIVRSEFERATKDIEVSNPVFKVWEIPTSDRAVLIRYYVLGDDLLGSYLWMTISHGKLIKARLTWSQDSFIDSVAQDFLTLLSEGLGAPIDWSIMNICTTSRMLKKGLPSGQLA